MRSGTQSSQRSDAHRSAVRQLTSLFEASQRARPVFLLGAGASYRSGVPLADDAVKRIAKEVYAKRSLGTSSTARVMPGDIARILSEQTWFIDEPGRLGDNFPLAVRHLLVPREYRREFFRRELRPFNGTSEGYHALARLAQRGLSRVTLTTNFDGCVVEALSALAPHVPRPVEINQTPADHVSFSVYGHEPMVVYLHGAIDSYTDLNTDEETESLPPGLVEMLKQMLTSSPLVVVGYRGGEPSIMNGLFQALMQSTLAFKCGVYWCDLGRVPLHPRVQALHSAIGGNFFELTIDGFDDLLVDLDDALRDQDVFRPTVRAEKISLIKTSRELVLEDLDQDLILAKLGDYCDKVLRPRVDRARMWALLGELGLVLTDVSGEIRPTPEAVLLFGKDVQSLYPQACVEFTQGGKKRKLIKGNLIQQFAELRELLESAEVNPQLRLKTNSSSKKQQAYNSRSMTEMIVNMLVHRDYAAAEQSKIDVEEGNRIRFTNPGGLPEVVLKRLSLSADGEFAPVRSVTDIRNYSIADVFYGIGPMDKRGSGLCDAKELMREHGGTARYSVEAGNTHFIAELLQARQRVPGASETALALHPFGVYMTNHLRFEVMPGAITTVDQQYSPRINVPSGSDLLGQAAPENAHVLIRQRDRVVSFCTPAVLGARSGTYKAADADHFAEQPGGHGTMSHLLREHFVRYLRGFQTDGLFVEDGGHRAYFVKLGDDPVKIKYDGPKRSGVEREMVKRRENKRDVFHENEGFAFDVIRFQGSWAVQIKPFYMFTEADGRTPLPPYRRTKLSTSRMRFDRNQAVVSDLGFWSRYLARGATTVQLCPTGDYDLLMAGAFHEIEIFDPSAEDGE
jgi:hypothetical protein